MKITYSPCLKTTDAELRGFSKLDDSVKDALLPIFELTRSRTSKNNPHGDVATRLEAIKSGIGSQRPFILDLTTHPDLSNAQINALLDEEDGFVAWRKFIDRLDMNVIPAIHIVEGGSPNNLSKQVKEIERARGNIAFRADVFDPNTQQYVSEILGNLSDVSRLIIILDAMFIKKPDVGPVAEEIGKRIGEMLSLGITDEKIVTIASSYPRSVDEPGYGNEHDGYFPAEEISLHDQVVTKFPKVRYGDYASVHPVRYPARGGGWIPRVDFPLDRHYSYHRYRRDEGGYVKAAGAVINDKRYQSIGTWGDGEIAVAAAGNPTGRSPSFWISARVNIHITRQLNRCLSLG
jgi:hypothetical protein